jgi:hypothetical protein
MLASLRVMGVFRLAVVRCTVATAETATAAVIMIWGRVVVNMFFHFLCICVLHRYNMSVWGHIPQNTILRSTI